MGCVTQTFVWAMVQEGAPKEVTSCIQTRWPIGICKRKVERGGRARCSRKGAQAEVPVSLASSNRLAWKVQQGLRAAIVTVQGPVVTFLPNSIRKPRHLDSPVYFISLTLSHAHQGPTEVGIAAPFHRLGTWGQTLSQGSASLRGSGVCQPEFLHSPELPQKRVYLKGHLIYLHASGAKG